MSTPSGNSNSSNIHNSFKTTSPVLTKEYGYCNWRHQLSVLQALTLLEKDKQGLAVFLSLTSQDKHALRTIIVENLRSANGVKLIIEELGKFYLKDESSLVYEAYKTFEKFSRPHEMCLNNYVIKFENSIRLPAAIKWRS